ncbi:class I SAM-dependent methyltransferase [Burkholderia alba]|uniref:class I SAM-dependent methyltransferase n=1 Tax=Burkholderia alba TaxID=2683677 RepID=UPI002B0575AF|nr:class I SAM-dependent methyltransferase [Burkholderia alba]
MKHDLVQDSINRAAWRSRSARNGYGKAAGWTDPGEAAAFAWIAEQARGQPILDVGVGGGRTVSLLTTLSGDYIAIDYTPELVEICRRNHPGIRVQQMDARDMSAFEDGRFSLVVFSYNGIDAVDYPGRLAILKEFSRVLKPGGLALFSTHNLHGPSYRRDPRGLLRLPRWSANPLTVGVDVLRMLYTLPVGTFNYLRNSRHDRIHDGYAVRVCAAHKFGIVIVYTDFATQRRQLADAGLEMQVAFGSSTGASVREGADVSRDEWFHFIASKTVDPVR